ncbi:MAG: glyoxalase [Serratia marcescens]|uniref:VOC family protein n=1 Tax=Serratia marcescens TaxID=615 RepID=UPI000E3C2F41|nr:glyoxalase [Serratia marcescens]MDU3569552.1 glyoxalase [Serratia marcescens]MDU3648833.1 glyoxalase [Serratia marcescens]RFT81701.1 glyoxalase [Serratia marcescens]TFZ80127.1 glyoxalase [Serratia marcescens]HEJ8099296.1 glyoxalase [Serratia marcescens]
MGPQYDTTHVYVERGKMDAFVDSILKTFGGTSTERVLVNVTPTPSETYSQLILTPAGSFSVFDFKTPIPYPFGAERNGFLVRDMDAAIRQAKAAGADVQVEPFDDPIGRDAVIQWPGGVNMQLYWHTKAPNYKPLLSVPENRLYLSAYRVDDFLNSYRAFSHAKLASDAQVSDAAIGRNGNGKIRQIELDSRFGKTRIFVTDGHLPYPFGHERTGYGVDDLSATLAKATASGAQVLWHSTAAERRASALVSFPGGYIAEIHQTAK